MEDMKKLHVKHNLKMLHDRRKLFMLKIMYKLSREAENVNTYRPEVMLRTGPKVKMKIDFTDKDRVCRSPYYLCNKMWNKLNSSVQRADTLYAFKKHLKKMDLTGI